MTNFNSNGQHPARTISKFTPSSPKNPCPVCGRTKDGDCRTTDGGFVLCHTYRNDGKGDTRRGYNGEEWACIGHTTDGAGWGVFKVHQPLEKRERWRKPPRNYPRREWQYLHPDGSRHTFYKEPGQTGRWFNGAKPKELLPLYHDKIAQAAGAGEFVVLGEGESVAQALQEIGICGTTLAGGAGATLNPGAIQILQPVYDAGRLVFAPDRDQQGLKLQATVLNVFPQVKFLYADPDNWEWSDLPKNGGYDLADWISDLRNQGWEDAAIKARILGAIGDQRKPPKPTDDGETPDKPERKSVANLLIEIARTEAQVWQSDSGDTWADITVNGVFQWHPVRSKAFKNWLSRRLFELHEKPANNEAMQACLNLLEAYAYGTPKRPVFLRTAQDGIHIYIDLTDDQWRVVQVSPDGWRVIDSRDCPVRFARHDGQQPLPVPVAGGDINKLWELIPVVRESDRCLLLAWLTFGFTPGGAKPILTLHGAKGAGKSWTAQTLGQLIDPVKAPLLKAVGDNRQMAVTASKRWILAFDNLTSLTTDEQDSLCCAATGAGFSHRKLHTDMDEVFYEYTRPQILTAVDCIPSRSDLLDRCLLIAVDRIPEDQRVPLERLEVLQEQYRPGLLGALLDRVALGLKFKNTIKAPLPRMADFARFAMAIETGLGQNGLQSGSFESAYRENIAGAVDKAIDSNPVAAAILELMSTCTRWEGTAGALLEKLQGLSDDPKIKKLTTRTLGRWLSSKANQTDLQAVGVEMDSYRTKHNRGWLITYADRPDNNPKMMSPTSPTSPPRAGAGSSGDMKDKHDVTQKSVDVTHGSSGDMKLDAGDMKPDLMSPPKPRADAGGDISDIGDIKKPCLSGGTADDQGKSLSGDTAGNQGKKLSAIPKSKDPDCGQKFKPGQMVRYTGKVPWIKRMFPHPVRVISFMGDCLTLPRPDKPGETVQVTPNDWEVMP